MKLYIAEQYNTLNQLDFMYYPDNTNKRYYYGPDRQRNKTALELTHGTRVEIFGMEPR